MSAPSVVAAGRVDAALMRFPYETWIAMPDAARHVATEGLPAQALTTVVRTGRRRGVLLVRRQAGTAEVKRILRSPHRP